MEYRSAIISVALYVRRHDSNIDVLIRFIALILGIALLAACGNDVPKNDKGAANTDVPAAEENTDLGPNQFQYSNHKGFWHWEDEFSKDEREKLKLWITTVLDANTKTLGYYPFDIHFYFHQSSSSSSPVSYGHTSRGKQQAVNFYVDPSYSLERFLDGWTAPHEISHLSLPFLGKQNQWFAEGYATYMSRRILLQMNHYTQAEFDSIYYHNITETLDCYGSNTSTHVEVSDSLISHHQYGTMYWGCSSFFYTANLMLVERNNMPMVDIIKAYQKCCRLEDETIEDVVISFDEIIEDDLFVPLLEDYRTKPAGEVMERYAAN